MGDFTYEHVFDVLRRERSRDELQQLDPDFYESAQAYIETQSVRLRASDVLSEEGERVRSELSNAKKLLRELYDRREKKIMLLALNKARTGSSIIDVSTLLPSEKDLFTDMVRLLERSRGAVSMVLTADTRPKKTTPPPPTPKPAPAPKQEIKKEIDGIAVRITVAVPKFMGSDKETFGPYEQGQHVRLPERIATILVKKGRAEHA